MAAASGRRGGRNGGTVQLRTLKAPGVKTIKGMFNQQRLDDKHMALADEALLDPLVDLLTHSHAGVRSLVEGALMQLEKDEAENAVIMSSTGCQNLYKLLMLKEPKVQAGAMWSAALLSGGSDTQHDAVIKDIGWLTVLHFARGDGGAGADAQVAAVTCVSNLCLNGDCHEMVIKEGGIELLRTLGKSTRDVNLLRPIANAFANLAAEEESLPFVIADGGLELIVGFSGEADDELVSGAVHCLANLSIAPALRSRLVAAGCIPVACRLLRSRDAMIVKGATSLVQQLAGDVAIHAALLQASVCQPLTDLAKAARNPEIQQQVAGAFAALCGNPATHAAVRIAGAVKPLRSLARSRNAAVSAPAIEALTALGESFRGRRERSSNASGAGASDSDDDDPNISNAPLSGNGGAYEVMWDFTAQADGEITVSAGTIVFVEDTSNADWWFAVDPKGGTHGHIPPSYLKKVGGDDDGEARRRAEEEEARRRAEEEAERRRLAEAKAKVDAEAEAKRRAEEEEARRAAAAAAGVSSSRNVRIERHETKEEVSHAAFGGSGASSSNGVVRVSDSTTAYGAFGSSELYANLAGVRGKPEEEDAKITLVEPLPSSVLFSSLSLQLEAQDRTLKLTMEWIDEHDSAVIRTRRVMWDLAWVAHPMYVDAFFRHGEFIAHVFKPKPDGRFRRLVVPELRLGADPSSGRQRVEVQPREDADASEFHCLLLPSVFPEQGRVFFVDGREFHFVFSHQETQQLSDGTSVITDLATHRHISLPLSVPSRTVFFSPPLSVIAMRGLKSHESTGNIQIINLELH